MSLRLRTLLLLGITFTLCLVALYLITDVLFQQSTAKFEAQTSRTDADRVHEALANDADAFNVLMREWSIWDDTYAFVQDGNTAFLETNVTPTELKALDLNVMAFLDRGGKIVYDTGFDLEKNDYAPLPRGLDKYLIRGSPLLTTSSPEPRSGFIQLPDGVMLIGVAPILDSLQANPSDGTLIFGRYFDSAEVAKLSKTTNLKLDFYPWNASDVPSGVGDVRRVLSDSTVTTMLPRDDKTLWGFTRIEDLWNKPVFLVQISIERTTYEFAQSALRLLLISLSLIGMVGIVSVLLISEQLVLRPVAQLSNQVRHIGDKPEGGARVSLKAQGELASLGTNINTMLATLESSRQALENERARYRAIVEGQREWIVRFLPDGRLTFVNAAYCRTVGKSPEELMGTSWLAGMPEAPRREAEECLQGLSIASPIRSLEIRVPNKDGTFRWQNWTWHAILDNAGHIVEIQGIGNDVTERVLAEEQSRYLSTHDALTGLYNRAYFEAELERIEKLQLYPVSIVVGDLDHLKLINDRYGHAIGDAAFRLASKILSGAFRAQDVIARIGGDEFAVVLPGADETTARTILQRITHQFFIQNLQANIPPVNMSLGLATAEDGTRLDKTLQLADEKMYESKFEHRQAGLAQFTAGVNLNFTEAESPGDQHAWNSLLIRTQARTETLNGLVQQLSGAESSLEAAQYIAAASDRILQWDAFFIAMYSEERNIVLASILAVDVVNGIRTTVTTPDEMELTPILKRAIAQNGLLILRRSEFAEPVSTLRFGDEARPSASLMYMPIRHRNQVIGILSVQSYTYNAFDESGLEFLRTLAEHCGGALARIQAQDSLFAKTIELERAYDQTIEGWSEALDLRDHEIRGHAQRVMELTINLAERLGIAPELRTQLRRGALLHDIGKMAMPDEILFKPGPLNHREWQIMRRHPQLAFDMLKNIEYLRPALEIPFAHHERWDGSGYPRGLRGEEIPLAARIFAVVDVWDALCSDRPYRKAWQIPQVRQYLIDESNKMFDPHVVRVFLEMMDKPINSEQAIRNPKYEPSPR